VPDVTPPASAPPLSGHLRDLVSRQPAGRTLLGEFYRDDAVYREDLARIWRTGWLFAGHSCEIPGAGDWFTLEVDADSLVVVRGEDGAARALYNTCRHRGSLVCTEAAGHAAKRLICPYHQWAYGFDGSLVHAAGMQESLDRSTLGLATAHLREVEGLIFVSLSASPPDFTPVHKEFAPALKPQGLARAKIAAVLDYRVKANWKLVWENNRECFHCVSNHPQYVKANLDHYNPDDVTPRIREQMEAMVRRAEAKWASCGLGNPRSETGLTPWPDPERNVWWCANRTPLVDGYLSESMDGKPVSTLMGSYPDPDVGTLRMRTLPNFWNHSSCDHGVTTRLLPSGPQETLIRAWWLVDAKAVEGRDYDLTKLMPFWQLTSEQDWVICERQQRGVNSSAYAPGPYSTYKEYNVDAYIRWYLNHLTRTTG